jgi:hypothetical protein
MKLHDFSEMPHHESPDGRAVPLELMDTKVIPSLASM